MESKIDWNSEYIDIDTSLRGKLMNIASEPEEIISLHSKGGDLYDLSAAVVNRLSLSTPKLQALPGIRAALRASGSDIDSVHNMTFDLTTINFENWVKGNNAVDEFAVFENVLELIQKKHTVNKARQNLILSPIFIAASALTWGVSGVVELFYHGYEYFKAKRA
jgi:hypothetical protein